MLTSCATSDTGIETLEVVTALESRFIRLRDEVAEYHEIAGRITDRLCNDHEEVQAAFKLFNRQEAFQTEKTHNQLTKLDEDVNHGLNEIIRTKDDLSGEVRDLRDSLEVKNDLVRGGIDEVHEQLVKSTEDLAAKVQSVGSELILKIDPICAHISIWRKEMTRIVNENFGVVKALHDEVIPLKATVSDVDRRLQGSNNNVLVYSCSI